LELIREVVCLLVVSAAHNHSASQLVCKPRRDRPPDAPVAPDDQDFLGFLCQSVAFLSRVCFRWAHAYSRLAPG
jgi:hypothetical protein